MKFILAKIIYKIFQSPGIDVSLISCFSILPLIGLFSQLEYYYYLMFLLLLTLCIGWYKYQTGGSSVTFPIISGRSSMHTKAISTQFSLFYILQLFMVFVLALYE